MAGSTGARLPLQGGLPPDVALTGAVREIACDESGFSGTNLLDPATPVIVHAGVDLSRDEAAELIRTLRSGFRFSPDEVKSRQFLRRREAAEAVQWFLSALRGRAHVHLVDKEFFLATRVVDLLLAEPSYAAGTRLSGDRRPAAAALHRAGRAAGPGWTAFLAAVVEMLRTKRRDRADDRSVERFFAARDALRRHVGDAQAGAVLDALDPARVAAVQARLYAGDRTIPPPLEPLLPALAETVLHWSGGGRWRVLVIHDEQSALTEDRLRRLQAALAAGDPAGPSPLAGLVMADSRDDPRVQAADLLAGVARRMPGVPGDGPLRPLLSPAPGHDPGAVVATHEAGAAAVAHDPNAVTAEQEPS
ncbi:DUF3800 domain-containing protein [Micromonospora sp. ANENR4]|uniref:DUF3800 domain-containing protein n=1 Tax=Micromonospora sp. ANENR4 TaxID=2783662 RepID=UPI0018904E88|nr:DUF3800 domain-containing protein [Micromonospora sp. ANENR4]MBF5030825.1 DUF3800 domain-containing protein [Micromonospora sp. ANENR4]